MPYTLTKGLLWFVLALLLGVVIGWLLRSIRATRQIRAARTARHDTAAASLAAEPEPEPELEPEPQPVGTAHTDDTDVPDTVPAEPPPDTLAPDPVAEAPAGLDLTAAEAVIGKRIAFDDLTAIDGIRPDVAELCHGIGIHTWRDLADTEVSLLATMLADAGPQFGDDHPDSWPTQAELLLAGRWQEYRDLVARLVGGRLPE